MRISPLRCRIAGGALLLAISTTYCAKPEPAAEAATIPTDLTPRAGIGRRVGKRARRSRRHDSGIQGGGKGPDRMLHVRCDIHSWMTAFIAVEPHRFFSVSAADGSFTIGGVPAGRHTVRVWHEKYGELTQMVTVASGKTVMADFSYTGQEHPSTARVQDVLVPEGVVALSLQATE